jgi:hypothetical protein
MKARIKKMVDFEISPQRIFMGPTISEIAHIINKEMNNRSLIEQLSSNATTQDENDVEEFTP